MARELHITLPLDDKWEHTLEAIKALLMTDERTGITHASPLESVYMACADVGVATLAGQMMGSGEWSRFADEASLGAAVDDILGSSGL